MGLGETAQLIINLKLQDQASAAIKGVQGNIGKLGSSFSKIGAQAKQGLTTAASNIAKIGIAAAGAVAVIGVASVKAGLSSLAELETLTKQTNAVIKSTGGAAGITAKNVEDLANQLEDLTTVDDKVIRSGENMLLTFTNIGKDVFPDATKAMVNLGVAMANGDASAVDLQATAIQLGKALNDPVKGVTALTKVGVSFTEQQKDQIDAMVKAGDVAGAQRVILAELAKEFGNAGEAAGTGYAADMRRLDDAVEGAQQALAIGFLPVIQEVAKFLREKLSDPKVLAAIKDLGTKGAGLLRTAFESLQKLPWAQIGQAFQLMATGSKALFDAFMGLPDWVKTAVITGWGLNKLTGGALSGIMGELAKGLIKGVLGMTAAVVNINAATANLGGAGATSAIQAEAAATGSGMVGALKTALAAAFTVSTAYLIFKPVADTIGTLIGGALGTKPAAPNTPGSLFLSGTPFGGGFDIEAYRRAHGLDPKTGLPVAGGQVPAGQTGASLGFVSPIAIPHTSGAPGKPVPVTDTQTPEQISELQRIAQISGMTHDQLSTVAGELPKVGQDVSKFIQQWASSHDAAVAAGFKGGTEAIRREIASKLGITVNELMKLRSSFRTSLASELGLTNSELRHLRQSTHYDEQRMADKLGISVEQLREIKDKARSTAANTAAIKNKNWSPKITIPVNINNKVAISGRQIYNATQRQIIRQGGGPIVE